MLNQRDLFDHQIQRRVIRDQVVTGQLQQPAPLFRIMGSHRPDHRRLAHIDAVMAWIYVRAESMLSTARPRFAVLRQPLQLQLHLALHHLHRFREPLPQHGRA